MEEDEDEEEGCFRRNYVKKVTMLLCRFGYLGQGG